MGQKVSPIGLRIGINKDWEAKWYANNKDFSKCLESDMAIRKFLDKRLKDASISKVEIERNNKKTEVTIHTSKPGVIIGRGGEEIEKLKKEISTMVGENVQISIVDIKKPEVDANLVAQSIANQIENRASFRMAQKRAIRNAMKNGVKGIKTLVSGRLLIKQVEYYQNYEKRLFVAQQFIEAASYNILRNVKYYNNRDKDLSQYINAITELRKKIYATKML